MTSRALIATAGAAAAVLAAAVPAQAATEEQCAVVSFEVQWGVKESFRSYLSGSIAKGEWSTEGNVFYQTPLFTISGSDGAVAADVSSGELSTTGSIRFYGHEGILDQTLSSPRVLLTSSDTLSLVFDVYGATQEGVFVDSQAVRFVDVDASTAEVDYEQGRWQLIDAPTVFTEEGQQAFGTYPAGEAFDPVTIRFATEPGCLDSGARTHWLVVAGGLIAAVLGVFAKVWVRKSRGREHRAPTES